jgi:hypothetical protein
MPNIKKITKQLIPKKIWIRFRASRILARHKKVADFWNPVIHSYFNGEFEKYTFSPKKDLSNEKIIWQYWAQGIDKKMLPEIIQICFASVDKYKGEYQVIRLSDETIRDYIDLPEFVWEKRKNNSNFNYTFFSDLLRIALLKTYGGVWLDATILLTGILPHQYETLDFFAFQRSEEEKNKPYWENAYAYYFGWHKHFKVRILNSILFAKKENTLISSLLDLMLYFWKTQETIPDYFYFQILFNELITGKLSAYNSPIVNDCIPHFLQTKINGGQYDFFSFEQIIQQFPIHKMAYFNAAALSKLKEINQVYSS